MGEGLRLIIGGPKLAYALGFGVVCLVAEVFVPYHRYAGYLKFLTLVLFAYVAAAFSVQVPWGKVIISTIVPTLSLNSNFLLMIVAVFGTTISPYLFFWQASQEAEELRLSHRRRYGKSLRPGEDYFTHISIDTWIGMFVSNLIAFFIIVTTAATLNAHGVTRIDTRSSSGRSVETHSWQPDLRAFCRRDHRNRPACSTSACWISGLRCCRGFRLARVASSYPPMAHSASMDPLAQRHWETARWLRQIDAIAMLFWTAVVDGTVAVPIMMTMMLVVSGNKHTTSSDLT